MSSKVDLKTDYKHFLHEKSSAELVKIQKCTEFCLFEPITFCIVLLCVSRAP